MEWLVVTKPLWSHVSTPTRNDVFQYQEIVTPSTQALEIENFQLYRITKDMAMFSMKATFKTNGSNHSSMMNLYGEYDSHKTFSIMFIFIVDSTTINQICNFY
jgi:hypothetical protein